MPVDVALIKAPKLPREDQAQKIYQESDLILRQCKETDGIILFDPRGQPLSSEDFSGALAKLHMRGFKRLVFVVGGAFGVSQEFRAKAHLVVSLSNMVFNHHVAWVVGLEQVYRALSIQKGLPYHNANE